MEPLPPRPEAAALAARDNGPMAKATRAYTVRPATKDDLRAIVGIYNWAVNQTFATIASEPLDTEEAQAWWEAHGRRSKLHADGDERGASGRAGLLPGKQRRFEEG